MAGERPCGAGQGPFQRVVHGDAELQQPVPDDEPDCIQRGEYDLPLFGDAEQWEDLSADRCDRRGAGELTYDGLNRLITAATADTSWGLSFSYDGFGNWTESAVTKGLDRAGRGCYWHWAPFN